VNDEVRVLRVRGPGQPPIRRHDSRDHSPKATADSHLTPLAHGGKSDRL
jgi:hypothetical protein